MSGEVIMLVFYRLFGCRLGGHIARLACSEHMIALSEILLFVRVDCQVHVLGLLKWLISSLTLVSVVNDAFASQIQEADH